MEMNFIIQETESIECMVELLDKCEVTCQAEVWSIFTAVLKKSVRNLQACTDVGLIQLVLQRIDSTDSMIAGNSLANSRVHSHSHAHTLAYSKYCSILLYFIQVFLVADNNSFSVVFKLRLLNGTFIMSLDSTDRLE